MQEGIANTNKPEISRTDYNVLIAAYNDKTPGGDAVFKKILNDLLLKSHSDKNEQAQNSRNIDILKNLKNLKKYSYIDGVYNLNQILKVVKDHPGVQNGSGSSSGSENKTEKID